VTWKESLTSHDVGRASAPGFDSEVRTLLLASDGGGTVLDTCPPQPASSGFLPRYLQFTYMNTRIIKLVVIGDSGVGKTSLRGQVRPVSRRPGIREYYPSLTTRSSTFLAGSVQDTGRQLAQTS
jgi:hypothetical protein